MRLIDLSHRLEPGMTTFPGDSPPRFTLARTPARDRYTGWEVALGMHLGTHVDVPMHLLEDSRFVADFPLEAFCGRGQLVWLPGAEAITGDMLGEITAPVVLVATGWDRLFSADPSRYHGEHPYLTECAAQRLVAGGVRLLGVDGPSPDRLPYIQHRRLLEAGVMLAENLTGLEQLRGKAFTFFAPPLKIMAEGSPVRAFALTE